LTGGIIQQRQLSQDATLHPVGRAGEKGKQVDESKFGGGEGG
jgi:hypothetical protein